MSSTSTGATIAGNDRGAGSSLGKSIMTGVGPQGLGIRAVVEAASGGGGGGNVVPKDEDEGEQLDLMRYEYAQILASLRVSPV
jgi:hypothetical protein